MSLQQMTALLAVNNYTEWVRNSDRKKNPWGQSLIVIIKQLLQHEIRQRCQAIAVFYCEPNEGIAFQIYGTKTKPPGCL